MEFLFLFSEEKYIYALCYICHIYIPKICVLIAAAATATVVTVTNMPISEGKKFEEKKNRFHKTKAQRNGQKNIILLYIII